MDRILAGAPERSNGALTIVALAIEAGVPRNALTQRHTDLNNEFYQSIRERGADNEDEARLRATIARLKKRSRARTGNSPSSGPTSLPWSARSTSSPSKTSSSATCTPQAAASSPSPAGLRPVPATHATQGEARDHARWSRQ